MKFIDHRVKVLAGIKAAVAATLRQAAEEVCQNAAKAVPRQTGTLANSISTRANQGHTFALTEIRFIPDKGRWMEVEEPTGRYVHVPHNEVEEVLDGWQIKVGAYAPYAASVEFGFFMPAQRPRQDRNIVGGKPRTNPHLRFGPGPTFTKYTRPHYVRPHPFFRPALDDLHRVLPQMMRQNLVEEMKKERVLLGDE